MNHSKQFEDDNISYSSQGETFSSRRRRKICSLKQQSIDIIAQKLKLENSQEKQDAFEDQVTITTNRRFNNSFHSLRFVIVMFGGFLFGTMILLRYNITVAILSMVNQTAIYLEENPDKSVDDFLAEGYSLGGDFAWNNEIQHMIMSSYMIAYTLPQVPLTKLGLIIGNRRATAISLSLCALSTIATPVAAYWGWEYVLFLRLINGIGASAVLPMLLNLIENWMPRNEISIGLTCSQITQACITTANPLLSGYLSSFHWSYAFYVPGIVTLLFCLLWLILVTDTPNTNWLISQKELDLINRDGDHNLPEESSTKSSCTKEEQLDELGTRPRCIDVLKIPSFYAFIFLWCFYCSSYTCFAFIVPRYLRQFLKISVTNTGLYCSLIQSGGIISTMWPHLFFRICETKLKLSVNTSRRLAYLLVCCLAAATWTSVGLFHDSQLLILFLNRCFHGSNDIVVTGSMMINYSKVGLSSLVFSMVNTVGNLSVIFTSPTIGYILDLEAQSVASWSWIFIALGLSQLIMLLTYVIMIKTEPIEFKKKKNVQEVQKSIDSI